MQAFVYDQRSHCEHNIYLIFAENLEAANQTFTTQFFPIDHYKVVQINKNEYEYEFYRDFQEHLVSSGLSVSIIPTKSGIARQLLEESWDDPED